MTTWSHPRHPLIEARMDIFSGGPILKGLGIGTRFVVGRYRAGESIGELAYDYSCTEPEIEAAIRFEMDAPAKRAHAKWRKALEEAR